MKLIDHPIIHRRYLLEGLHKLHNVLSSSPLHNRYWVCGGMLLGYAREGRLLRHDPDVDFHFWHEDLDRFLQSAELLKVAGFTYAYRWNSNAGETTEYVLLYKRVRFEFFVAHRVDSNTRWYVYAEDVKRGVSTIEILQEVPGCTLDQFEFLGKTWLKPANHTEYLTAVYGAWQTPDRHWKFHHHSVATVSVTPRSGKQVW